MSRSHSLVPAPVIVLEITVLNVYVFMAPECAFTPARTHTHTHTHTHTFAREQTRQ